MEIMDPNTDAIMDYDVQNDDLLGEDLMDVEHQKEDANRHPSSSATVTYKNVKGSRSGAKLHVPLGIQNKKMGFLRRGSPRSRSVKPPGRSHRVDNEKQRRNESKRSREISINDDGLMCSKNPSKHHL